MTLLSWEMSTTVWGLEHTLVLVFLGTGVTVDLFQSYGHCWVFQICRRSECSSLVASSSRVLSSSPGIPSPPPALLTAVTPQAYLISRSRMSGSLWLTISSQSSGSLRLFLYMYPFHLCLISLASTGALSFPACIVSIFGWNGPLRFPIFLKRSLVFPLLLFSCSFLNCSLKSAFLSPLVVMIYSLFYGVCIEMCGLPRCHYW